ncbi:sigma 54-interacting transcriptional regulator [Pueribacillus sp. YX66]|uniref:sigma 54-interacting transcriptional regulator n=1 Tax=Pueribacillus sp. YX66 TaxID=3229242 RepID=UPI00358D9B59
MPKIIVTGFSPLESLVREALEERKKNFSGLVIQKIESKDILRNPSFITNDDVLICGQTIYKVFKELNVRGQMVPVRVQINDFIHALRKARQYGYEINVINYNKKFLMNAKDELEKIFNLKINQYVYESTEHAEKLIAKLESEGQSIVIGSGLITSLAKSRGMHGILWYGEESITQAVGIAFNILQSRFEELKNFKQEEYILQKFNDGVITLSEAGRISNINKKALSLLELENYKSPQGSHILHLFKKSELTDILLSKKEIRDKVVTYEKKLFLISTFPIVVNHRFNGTVAILSDVDELQKNETKIRQTMYSKKIAAPYRFDHIIGNSEKIKKTVSKAKKFASTDSNILILGETGTGKELFAQSIHNESARVDKPFIAVNCAAVPENLLESEFFGYSDGAFTGAKKGGKPGYFEQAHNGTIFLDEIGELPLSMQAKLLRVLQEQVVMPVGSSTIIPINVRVISATNVNLIEKVKTNEFRKDLYYRLAVLNLFLPPLQNRLDDLGEIVKSFTKRNYPHFLNYIEKALKEMVKLLSNHKWHGNIRELENTLERMFAYLEDPSNASKSAILENLEEALEENYLLISEDVPSDKSFHSVMKETEIQQINEVLKQTNGNKQKAAEILGMSRSTLWRKLRSMEQIN